MTASYSEILTDVSGAPKGVDAVSNAGAPASGVSFSALASALAVALAVFGLGNGIDYFVDAFRLKSISSFFAFVLGLFFDVKVITPPPLSLHL